MSMQLSHYSDSAALSSYAVSQHEVGTGKPRGLWVSVDGPDDWAEWNSHSEFRDTAAQYRFKVTLADDANILVLPTPEAVQDFSMRYGTPIHARTGGLTAFIDWAEVAQEYQGIIIAPYQWPLRYLGDCAWYYGWDCASGCIWDADAIQNVTLHREPVTA